MSDNTNAVFRLFAIPGGEHEAEERRRFERLLFARLAAHSLCDGISASSRIGSVSSNAYDIFAEWANTKPDFWSRTVGHLWRANVFQDDEVAAGAIVVIGIHASASGIRGNWNFKLPKPISFRLSDVVLLSIRSGHIESNHGNFRGIFESDASTISYERLKDGTIAWQVSGDMNTQMNAPCIVIGGDRYHLVPSVLASADLLPCHAESEYDDQFVNETASQQLSKALRTLFEISTDTYQWVSSVIREVIPLRPSKGNAGSTSCQWDCGTIALTMTDLANPVLFGEMLVHEASHQHFFLAKQLGPIHDGSDDRMYFSPMVGADRPLEKMLLGYHAVVNMLSFYRSLNDHADGRETVFIAKRTDYLFEKSNCIRPVLSKSTALTPLGKAMYEALYERECILRA
ncbi:MAG: HEXXH motif-containing putative peptide modification protein [Reyranella sp.]|uniref:aKG-HExxH-type peptide beta-hydroxylase n=1 Tax=Reyranella sp. TaxID=1929291 RepID=UPI003D0DF6F0